ncbi:MULTISPECIES: DUF1905 domain-containing protein [unclassified Salinibacterium]|uniref:DUF1905 domain-containing protein n=1 Tax=unclassified Salinibacterium TaxID=2632331 RepID=UPI00141EE16B|nr:MULTISPECIES: DUF1905 domain-containing protein [unclassified Salinibacterium]
MRFEFRAEVRPWKVRRDDWYFVDVPAEFSAEIREWADARPRAGFGAVKVAAGIGATHWSTSIFPDSGVYVLALNARVRRAEGIEYGDEVDVEIEIVD